MKCRVEFGRLHRWEDGAYLRIPTPDEERAGRGGVPIDVPDETVMPPRDPRTGRYVR